MDKILVEDFLEVGNTLICRCHKVEDGATVFYREEVSFSEFNSWLKLHNYLSGKDELLAGADHTGEPIYYESTYTWTIGEILSGESDWTATKLLEEFINQKPKA